MSNKTGVKQVAKGASKPTLRFPAFVGQSCRDVRLQDVTAECPTRNGNKLSPMSVMGVTKAEGIIPMQERLIGANISRYKLVRKNWFAYNPMRLNIGSIGRWPNDSDILVSPDYVVFRCLEEPSLAIDPQYLDHFRRSEQWENFVTESGIGSVRVRIYYNDIARLQLKLPKVAEQQKIADCLTSLDEVIAAHSQKCDALKTHKKGLMQQLFPLEGETQPRLRFPEFQDAGEWAMKSIGQLGKVVTGSTPSTARADYYGGDRLFVSPADISDDRFIKKTKTTLTALGFGETRPIKANSILFVCIGSTIGKIVQNRHECATNQQINSVVPNSGNSDGFIYYALSGMADKIANYAGIQAVPIVNKSLFSSVELAVPKLPEQTRIADCLSSLDETIFAQTKKLEALKTHKKGLMQQLFPSPAEVEG